MAARTRIRRKELRQPDEFVSLTARLLAYGRANSRTVGWIGTGLLTAAVATFAFSSFRSIQEERANSELTRAIGLLQSAKYGEAFTVFDDLSRRASSSPVTSMARIYAGQSAAAAGNLDGAVDAFENALRANPSDYLRQRALIGLAYAFEARKDPGTAARRFEEAAAIPGPYKATAVFGRARALDQAGSTQAAIETYNKFITDFPDAPEKTLAAARLATMR